MKQTANLLPWSLHTLLLGDIKHILGVHVKQVLVSHDNRSNLSVITQFISSKRNLSK